MALMQRLDQNTKTILDDVNEDGQVNYVDALTWSGLIHKDNYLLNFERVEKLSLAITQGASNVEVRTLALAVLEDESQLSLQFFTDNISMSIVQSKCVTTNSNSNHIAINHQVFIDFAGLSSFRTQDFSDYVSAKASGQSFHFGGVQLAPGSTALNNLKTYLNMIE
jgi:anti-sigma28 factor (negative regulator of flagellin synthesis)